MKVHFAGPGGAMKFYKTGEETVDAYGTKTSTYAEGGEYDLSDAQIQEILKNGKLSKHSASYLATSPNVICIG
jgi:hypothetical protein